MTKIQFNETMNKAFNKNTKVPTWLFITLLLSVFLALAVSTYLDFNYRTETELNVVLGLAILSMALVSVTLGASVLPDMIDSRNQINIVKQEFKNLGITYSKKDSPYHYGEKDGEKVVARQFEGVLYIGTSEEISSLSNYMMLMKFWSCRTSERYFLLM